MANRIAGVAYIKVNGRQYALRGNLVVSPANMERAGIAGQDEVHGFSENPRTPSIAGDFSTTGGLSTDEIIAMDDVTVTAELANSKTYVLQNAWYAGAPEINAKEGQVPLRWEGKRCIELN